MAPRSSVDESCSKSSCSWCDAEVVLVVVNEVAVLSTNDENDATAGSATDEGFEEGRPSSSTPNLSLRKERSVGGAWFGCGRYWVPDDGGESVAADAKNPFPLGKTADVDSSLVVEEAMLPCKNTIQSQFRR